MSKKNIIFLVAILVAVSLAVAFYLYKENQKINIVSPTSAPEEKHYKTDEEVIKELQSAPPNPVKSDAQVIKELQNAPKSSEPAKTDEEVLKELQSI
ncbi:MAG: hypothetical protein M3P22_02620 [bacterium]|nr:hypothetical protein [bacterium]